jgi:hypothetical protein
MFGSISTISRVAGLLTALRGADTLVPGRSRFMDRRHFLTGASAAALASRTKAADTGKSGPVRTQPLRANYWGTEFYGEEEQQQVTEVISTRSPFRWYGDTQPMKVATFEKSSPKRCRPVSRWALRPARPRCSVP